MPNKSIYRIERGGAALRSRRRQIDRELHGVVVTSGDVAGRVPAHMADWFYDLRRKQLRVYGGLLRFIDVSVASGSPKEILDQIPKVLAHYIDDAYADRPDRAA